MSFAVPLHTQTPNELFDVLMAQMGNAELRITLVAIRKTFGWHKRIEQISLTQFQQLTGLSRNGVLKGLTEAIQRGTIREAGAGERGAKLYELVMREPSQLVTSSPTEPVKTTTSAVSEPVKPATSSPTEHTKERRTKERGTKERKELAVAEAPAQDAPLQTTKPKRQRKPKRTEAEKLEAENTDPIFLAIAKFVFGIADPTILSDGGRKRLRPLVGKAQFLFGRQFGVNEKSVLEWVIRAFCGKFEKGKEPRDYVKFEEKFTAFIQEHAPRITYLIEQAQLPPPEAPPPEDTEIRDYSKEVQIQRRLLFAMGAIQVPPVPTEGIQDDAA